MGLLIDGMWQSADTRTAGAFVRADTAFRNWVTPDGAPGPTGEGGFPAEPGRYHLIVSLACPWAHRTLIFRALKQLDREIGLSVVNPFMGDQGWTFDPAPGVIAAPVPVAALHQLYALADPTYTGRASVPVLWDLERGVIVSNESADVIRMLNSAFDHLGAAPGDYYPAARRAEIDALNHRIYATLNNGVYRAGFATTQQAYEDAVFPLFGTLDFLDAHLANRRFLTGSAPTEADWRLFTTLVRFDPVYATHFKCNLRRLVDYRTLWAYTRDLYQWPGIRETVDFTHIKRHYFTSHPDINPHSIIPAGPLLDFDAPTLRAPGIMLA